MHAILNEITEALMELCEAIDDAIATEDSLGISQNTWSVPFLNKNEIIGRIESTLESIEAYGTDKILKNEELLSDYPKRIAYIRDYTVPNLSTSANAAYTAIFATIEALDRALAPSLNGDPNAIVIKRIRNLDSRLRSREEQLNALGPKLDELQSMVDRIENAYNAADQLPTDLKSLQDARSDIVNIAQEVGAKRKEVESARASINDIFKGVQNQKDTADGVLERCQTALAGATSVGLAAAFSNRSKSLGWSVWVWTGGLIVALSIAGILGFWRISELGATIADTNASDTRTILQFLLSILSVGAPIWFAWLATRQIGQRFRIAEDYAFKASVSQAYEGYRREAARIDVGLEQQLLTSALTRLDEQPLRLVEKEAHASPINELLASPAFQKAFETVPNFAQDVRKFASDSIDGLTSRASARTKPTADLDEEG